MTSFALTLLLFVSIAFTTGCDDLSPTSDQKQTDQQNQLLQEGTAQVGMPNIKNFRERRIMHDILEMRDQDGLITYTYLQAEMTGKLCFLGNTIGYGIPYATQYTSPMRPATNGETSMQGNIALPQADPNGLFSPASAEGTWILMKDPNGTDTKPVYIEQRILTSPFKLAGTEPCYPGGPH